MTFELVRINWPNTVAILALAVMPAVSIALAAPRPAAEIRMTADAANCPLPGGAVIAFATIGATSLD